MPKAVSLNQFPYSALKASGNIKKLMTVKQLQDLPSDALDPDLVYFSSDIYQGKGEWDVSFFGCPLMVDGRTRQAVPVARESQVGAALMA